MLGSKFRISPCIISLLFDQLITVVVDPVMDDEMIPLWQPTNFL